VTWDAPRYGAKWKSRMAMGTSGLFHELAGNTRIPGGRVKKVDFELQEVMDAVGPSAALAFAAWLFLQLLQQRYLAAYSPYRELVDSFRNNAQGKRREVLKEEIEIYQ
jgi:hypothetical protein